MARHASEVLTEREAQIMTVLWELGQASSETIREQLAGDPHDSTVRTLLRVLKNKGYVQVIAKSRPTIYRPAIAQSKVQQKAARGLLQRFFGGSAETLVLRLLEDEHLTPEQLEQLKKSHSRNSSRRGKS
jgi:BlaI family transcriptional regulator, penicillinase repressor